jgi:hypothetical protein
MEATLKDLAKLFPKLRACEELKEKDFISLRNELYLSLLLLTHPHR